MKILGKATKEELHSFLNYGMSLDDKNLYEQLNKTQFGIFQFSGDTAAKMVRQVHVDNFNELVVVNALSRPGSSFALPDFIEAKNNPKQKKYPKVIDDCLKDSQGIIIFQEQIMHISELLSNGKIKGNSVRGLLKKLGKANPKQEDKDKWNEYVEVMKQNAGKLGLKPNEVNTICNDMLTLSKYSFNKSHAMAYSYIAAETIYLSRYFTNSYYSACLAYDASKKDVLKDSIKKVEERGYKILPPDVNSSGLHFYPKDMNILFGLNDIKGVGEEPAKKVIECRPYTSIIDFILKTGCNKRITDALVCGGAFDSIIGDKRKYFDNIVQKFYEKKKTIKIAALLQEKWDEAVAETPDCETTGEDYVKYEEEYLGGQFFHNKFTAIADKIEALYSKGYCLRDFDEIRKKNLPKQYCFVYVNSFRYHTDKNGNEMLFMEIEDRNGEKQSVPIFASYWKYVKVKFFAEDFYLMDLYTTDDGKIMFGSRNFRDSKNPLTVKNMMARVNV